MLQGRTRHTARHTCASAGGILQHLSQPTHLHLTLWCRQTHACQLHAENWSQVQETSTIHQLKAWSHNSVIHMRRKVILYLGKLIKGQNSQGSKDTAVLGSLGLRRNFGCKSNLRLSWAVEEAFITGRPAAVAGNLHNNYCLAINSRNIQFRRTHLTSLTLVVVVGSVSSLKCFISYRNLKTLLDLSPVTNTEWRNKILTLQQNQTNTLLWYCNCSITIV